MTGSQSSQVLAAHQDDSNPPEALSEEKQGAETHCYLSQEHIVYMVGVKQGPTISEPRVPLDLALEAWGTTSL